MEITATAADLLTALRNAQGSDARAPIREALRREGLDASAPLVAALADADELHRWEAVNLLGELAPEDAALAVVRFALDEDEVHARWRAAWAVTRFERAVILPALLAALDGPEPAQWRAALILSLLSDRRCVDALVRGVDSPDTWRQWEALAALRALGAPEALPGILRRIGDSNPIAVRQEAVLALGAVGGPDAIGELLGLLDNGPPQLRWRAAMALCRLDPAVGEPALRRRLEVEPDPAVRAELRAITPTLGVRDA
jgi:HEAT repeat protein